MGAKKMRSALAKAAAKEAVRAAEAAARNARNVKKKARKRDSARAVAAAAVAELASSSSTVSAAEAAAGSEYMRSVVGDYGCAWCPGSRHGCELILRIHSVCGCRRYSMKRAYSAREFVEQIIHLVYGPPM